MIDADGKVYFTPAEIAEELGRTPERVRQLMHGRCTCFPLPADRVEAPGCNGAGRLLTNTTSLTVWVEEVWDTYPRRWKDV